MSVSETDALPLGYAPILVMPAGLEPAISSLRGWRPNQLDDGTRWRYGPDSNRRNNSFAGCPLKPLEYRIMAGIVGFEPTVPASKAGALAAWQYPSIMEIRAGLEPVIAAVKGLCPNLLDERTILAGSASLRIYATECLTTRISSIRTFNRAASTIRLSTVGSAVPFCHL